MAGHPRAGVFRWGHLTSWRARAGQAVRWWLENPTKLKRTKAFESRWGFEPVWSTVPCPATTSDVGSIAQSASANERLSKLPVCRGAAGG
jgi:hypothetical protein